MCTKTANLPVSRSLGRLLLQRRVVIQGQLVHVDFHGLVEEDCSSGLSLEVDEEHLIRALGHLQNFKLHLSCLNYGHKIFLLLLLISIFVRRLVDLLFALKVDLPDVVGDLEGLILNLQILNQFRKDLLGRDRREEAVCLVGAFLVLLEREQDSVLVVSFALGQFRIFVPPVG